MANDNSTISTSFTALLIEDDEEDALLIKDHLRDVANVAVDLRHSVTLSLGLTELSQGGVDVVLLDMMLPDSKGLETVTRAVLEAEPTPVVVLTGADDEHLASQSIHHGAQDYLVKGDITGRAVVRAIRYAVERARGLEAIRESRRLIQQIADILYIYSFSDGRIVHANAELMAALGVQPQDFSRVLGHPFEEFLQLEDAVGLAKSRVALSTAKDGDTVENERRIKLSGNGSRWLCCRETVYSRNESGDPNLILGAAQDISRYKSREEELQEANARLVAELERA